MGGICSRKRNQPVIEDGICRAVSGRRSGSSKWLGPSSLRPTVEQSSGGAGVCPSLLELCICKICQVLAFYGTCKLELVCITCGKNYICINFQALVYLCLLLHMHLCYRTLTNTVRFQCYQGMLANRSLTNWSPPILLLKFLLKLLGIALWR